MSAAAVTIDTRRQARSGITVALAGNPNAGKTTLFNFLTGLKQKVANYPGVTVERKAGVWKAGELTARLIDLPGLYSLDTTSLDESISRDVLTGDTSPGSSEPDAIIAVVDATNLERNLYLVTQLFEFGIPVVVALTMIDVFEKQKHQIDTERLSELLHAPVVEIECKARTRKGKLVEAVNKVVGSTPADAVRLRKRETGMGAAGFLRGTIYFGCRSGSREASTTARRTSFLKRSTAF